MSIQKKQVKLSDFVKATVTKKAEMEYGIHTEIVLDAGLDGRSDIETLMKIYKIKNPLVQCPDCDDVFRLSDMVEHLYYPMNHGEMHDEYETYEIIKELEK